MIKDKDTRLSAGLTLAFFGLLQLLNSFNFLTKILSPTIRAEVLDWRTLFFYAAVFFLIFNKNKTTGLIFLVIGLLLRFNFIWSGISVYMFLFWPVSILTAGITFIVNAIKK